MGTLKSFNRETGYGFIQSKQVPQDVFLNIEECPEDGQFDLGRVVEFTLAYNSQGKPRAKSAAWLPVAMSADASLYSGRIKSIGPQFGFIDCPRTYQQYGRDIYFARSQLPSNVQPSQLVSFAVCVNSKGQPQARCLTLQLNSATASDDGDPEGCDGGGAAAAAPALPITHW